MPRSNQTKQLLAQSLQELMATTPLEKISVNDIVDHANVGRNTFYYHFEDKYDLVNWYFQSGITRFLVELSAYSSWNALLAALETYFLENKVFYCNALAYNGQNSLQQYMFDYLRSIFEQNVRELTPDASAEETRKIGQFFAGAMMGILIPWVLSGMKSNALSNMSELSIPVFNHEIRLAFLGKFQGQGQRLTEFRVRIGAGGKIAVRQLLLRHHLDFLNADPGQNLPHQLVAGAV